MLKYWFRAEIPSCIVVLMCALEVRSHVARHLPRPSFLPPLVVLLALYGNVEVKIKCYIKKRYQCYKRPGTQEAEPLR